MQNEDQDQDAEHRRTLVKAAYVLRLAIEDVPQLKETMGRVGAQILYERIGPQSARWWIVDRANDEPRDREGSR